MTSAPGHDVSPQRARIAQRCSDFTSRNSSNPKLPYYVAVSGLLVAPEGGHWIETATVDLHLAATELARYRVGMVCVLGPDTAGQAVVGVVGNLDGLVFGVVGNDREHGPEDLLSGDGHIPRDI